MVSLVRDRDLAHSIRTLYGIDRARRIQRSLEPQCLSGFRKDENSRILHSDVLIVADAGDFVFYDCIFEELLQSLGPINDDTTVPWTMFNDDVQMGFFDLYDQYLLNILYDRRIRPGMTRAEVEALLPEVLPRRPRLGRRQQHGSSNFRCAAKPARAASGSIFSLAARSLELLDQRRRQLHAVLARGRRGACAGPRPAAGCDRSPARSATTRRSLRWRSISAAKTSGAMKRDTSSATTNCPVLVGVRCRAPTDRPRRGRTPRR